MTAILELMVHLMSCKLVCIGNTIQEISNRISIHTFVKFLWKYVNPNIARIQTADLDPG